ncbi:fatty-acyl-CoA synthase [Bradyrhizobium elkanii]|jgi:fatty-acyl-CoA synthase|uniref:3-methylmercaptopropionyl-CoA ligase n=1 Tax=Bradyrhizobium elkanii TaxID=29448 RepID=A0A8I2BXW0_BRAEL|nr:MULTISPECIES: AMP-binding protein [Bradyrhizobium]MBP1291305.1 fatty-acyl-CoA synthase [Bradyrhizobium elkanii]MCP1928383.1 fatty-acyl-CoA synthase [Bradyrhizobium elkanii]MCS3474221.1 fatty-acyl-CoA synthase [Bradyrhizobium elkanii]MCS3581004.1 fatty-acyl-CoA synthase [Bradyrhizobium elkanii]MCS3723880.1 fatty-acyl-CoA synthase [Bradyrhizobium elkanii]
MSNPLYAFPAVCEQTLRALARYPSRTAFAWPGGSLSYQGATDLIGRMQGVFMRLGFAPGTRVALLTANRADSWCAGVAAQLSRLAITWLHPLGSLDDQLFQIEDSEAQMLIVDGITFRDRGGELAAKAQGLKTVFTLGPADYGADLLQVAEDAGSASAKSFAREDDISTLNYTGGTTGKSKGALRYHREYGGFAAAVLADFEIPETPRYLTVAPISHVAGTKVLPTLMRGGTVHMLKGFDPEAVFTTIAREKINFTLFVPTMIYVMLDHPALDKTDLSSLELLLYGASAMSPSRLVEGIERIGPVFSQLYGQTECYPVSVLRKADHDPKTPDLFLSCGFPIAACQVKILDQDDQEVATGEPGEICVRATHVMAEYWKRPDITAETLRSGWLHTGDIARMDERGYMFILDRKKDMIVSGGFNIFPREVEDVLSQHADVAMVAVVGVPDDKWGEAVTAVVVAREGTTPDADELIGLVKAKKGSAHAPKQIQFVKELPMTGVGKVDKKVLKARFWTGRDRMVG